MSEETTQERRSAPFPAALITELLATAAILSEAPRGTHRFIQATARLDELLADAADVQERWDDESGMRTAPPPPRPRIARSALGPWARRSKK